MRSENTVRGILRGANDAQAKPTPESGNASAPLDAQRGLFLNSPQKCFPEETFADSPRESVGNNESSAPKPVSEATTNKTMPASFVGCFGKTCLSAEALADLARRYREGATLNALAASAGMSGRILRDALVAYGVAIRPRGYPVGLWRDDTPERLAQVRKLKAEGQSFATIAEALGISRQAVQQMFRRAERREADGQR